MVVIDIKLLVMAMVVVTTMVEDVSIISTGDVIIKLDEVLSTDSITVTALALGISVIDTTAMEVIENISGLVVSTFDAITVDIKVILLEFVILMLEAAVTFVTMLEAVCAVVW